MKVQTLCLLRRDDQILLAMKKRGFGEGKWNGVGGKLQDGETVEQAALREMQEEIGVDATLADLIKVGDLKFHFKDGKAFNVHVFLVDSWTGEPRESEEMAPKWHNISEIPFKSMWPDDKHWLPQVLAGKKIEGEFHFTEDALDFEQMNVQEV
ncbi:8-oxo-dGTP diphosphatase [Candidatus Parcubacteria bacterium]|nr:8-oxo-dGTP diphosphatase [Candidatus Parcubacteria bacterium]